MLSFKEQANHTHLQPSELCPSILFIQQVSQPTWMFLLCFPFVVIIELSQIYLHVGGNFVPNCYHSHHYRNIMNIFPQLQCEVDCNIIQNFFIANVFKNDHFDPLIPDSNPSSLPFCKGLLFIDSNIEENRVYMEWFSFFDFLWK